MTEFPDKRDKLMGLSEACICVGMTLGPLLGGLIYSYVHYQWTFYIFAIFEINKKTDSVMEKIMLSNSNLEQAEALTKTKSFLEERATDIDKLGSFFIEKSSIVDFIEMMEGASREVGVGFQLNSVDVEKDELPIQFKIDGSWAEVVRMISLVENMPYKLNVDNVNLVNSDDGWTANMSVTIFSFLRS